MRRITTWKHCSYDLHNNKLLNILSFSGTCAAFSIAIIVPLISVLFSCTIHPSLFCDSDFSTGSKYKLMHFTILLLDMGFGCSCAVLGGFTATVSSMTLYCTYRYVQIFSNILKVYNASFLISAEKRRACALFYRELQILVILSNKCFQHSVWPNVQFCGSAIIISLLYSVIVLRHTLNSYLVAGMTLVFCSTSCFCLLVMDYGSRPQVLSTKKVLTSCRTKWAGWPLSRMFWKSCIPIAFDIGPFHKMDRQRGPALFRFCLQRTFFLVVQTKAVNHGSSAVNCFVTAGL